MERGGRCMVMDGDTSGGVVVGVGMRNEGDV